jgi:hypothetical protein
MLKVEWIKVRRTLSFYLCIGAPLLITVIMFLLFYSEGESVMVWAEGDRWLHFAKMIQTYWAFFFLPLLITLQTALMAGIDHRGQMWNLIYTQPVRRLDVLRAKFFSCFFIMGVSQMLLCPLTIAAGQILRVVNPALGLGDQIPVGEILLLNATVFGLSFLAMAIQIWISLHWDSFITAVSSGVIATVTSIVMANSKIAKFYPWAMPGLLANHYFRMDYPWINLLYSLGVGLLVILAGLLDMVSKETY